MRAEDWTTLYKLKRLDNAPEVKRAEDMVVSGFCLVGSSKENGHVCWFAKGHAISPDYPDGVFWPISPINDHYCYSASEVFKTPGLKVWDIFPKQMTMVGDNRPVNDGGQN